MVERVLALFDDEKLGRTAAASLGAIAEEKDGVLSKENFAVIRVRLSLISRSGSVEPFAPADTDHCALIAVRSCCTGSASSRSCCPSWLRRTRRRRARTRRSTSRRSHPSCSTCPSNLP